jgi:hypothetical protein
MNDRATLETPLELLLDVNAMRHMLRDALRAEEVLEPLHIRAAEPIVWKPGSRALVAYEVKGLRPSEAVCLYGKHYSRSARADRVYETWRMLEQVDFGPSSGVPRLVGCCPQISLVVYHRADGRPLDRLSTSDILPGIRAAGRWLAALHDSRLVVDRQFDWDKELMNVGLWADRVASACPGHADAAHRLAAGLATAGCELRTSNDVPIHKDFHYRHVIMGERTVTLDFDEFRMGPRSFDVAHFCAYLRLLELRGRAPAPIGDLQRSFVDAYTGACGWTAQPDLRIFSAYTCLKIAKQLSGGSGVAPRPHGARREHELEAVLAHGLALIDPVRNGGWS